MQMIRCVGVLSMIVLPLHAHAQPATTTGGLALVTTFPGRTPSVNAVGEVERGHWTTQYDSVEAARALPVGTRPFAIQFHYVRAGDGVRVRISALMDQAARTVLPIETVLVRPGEPVVAAALRSLGIRAPELAVEPVSPTSFEAPEIRTPTDGLRVAVGLVAADVPLYRVTLANATSRSVRAVHVTTFGPTGRLSATGYRRGARGAVLIPPGGSFTFDVRSLSLASNIMPLRARPLGGITIDAVVWSDGSFDGDPEPASRELVYQVGSAQQLARVLDILDRNRPESGQAAADVLERVRTALETLESSPEPADVRDAAARMSAATTFNPRNVRSVLRAAREQVRVHALADVREFVESRSLDELTLEAVAAWLAFRAGVYRDWLERLSAA